MFKPLGPSYGCLLFTYICTWSCFLYCLIKPYSAILSTRPPAIEQCLYFGLIRAAQESPTTPKES